MKKSTLIISLLLMAAPHAFATNGSNMIGFGPISRSMGGTGIAYPMGAESALKNPAMVGYTKQNEFLFAATYFAPSVSSQNMLGGGMMKEQESASDTFFIPSIGLNKKLSEKYFFSLGAFGTSGMGVDYRGTTANDGVYKMATSLSLMKFTPSLTYKHNNFTVGVSAAFQYGALSIAYDRNVDIDGAQGGGKVGFESAGASDDLGVGFDIGLGYKMNGYTIGLNYQSAIEMEYKYAMTSAAGDFGMTSITSDVIEQPAELGVGVAAQLSNWTLTADVKKVLWSDAQGYGDFGWEDQNVYAIGAAYDLGDETFFRFGYNYGETPLGDEAIRNVKDMNQDYSKHIFNILGFPATAEKHYTIGMKHRFTKYFAMDFAFVYAPEVIKSGLGNTGPNHPTMANTDFEMKTKHEEKSFTFGAKWSL
jgi:long-chain fatty acid transport protein